MRTKKLLTWEVSPFSIRSTDWVYKNRSWEIKETLTLPLEKGPSLAASLTSALKDIQKNLSETSFLRKNKSLIVLISRDLLLLNWAASEKETDASIAPDEYKTIPFIFPIGRKPGKKLMISVEKEILASLEAGAGDLGLRRLSIYPRFLFIGFSRALSEKEPFGILESCQDGYEISTWVGQGPIAVGKASTEGQIPSQWKKAVNNLVTSRPFTQAFLLIIENCPSLSAETIKKMAGETRLEINRDRALFLSGFEFISTLPDFRSGEAQKKPLDRLSEKSLALISGLILLSCFFLQGVETRMKDEKSSAEIQLLNNKEGASIGSVLSGSPKDTAAWLAGFLARFSDKYELKEVSLDQGRKEVVVRGRTLNLKMLSELPLSLKKDHAVEVISEFSTRPLTIGKNHIYEFTMRALFHDQ